MYIQKCTLYFTFELVSGLCVIFYFVRKHAEFVVRKKECIGKHKTYIQNAQKYTGLYKTFGTGKGMLQECTKCACGFHNNIWQCRKVLIQEHKSYASVQNVHTRFRKMYENIWNFRCGTLNLTGIYKGFMQDSQRCTVGTGKGLLRVCTKCA